MAKLVYPRVSTQDHGSHCSVLSGERKREGLALGGRQKENSKQLLLLRTSLPQVGLICRLPEHSHGTVSESNTRHPSRQRAKQKANEVSRTSPGTILSQRSVRRLPAFSILGLHLTSQFFETLILASPNCTLSQDTLTALLPFWATGVPTAFCGNAYHVLPFSFSLAPC